MQCDPNIPGLPAAEWFNKDAEHGVSANDYRGIPLRHVLTVDHEGNLGALIKRHLADPDPRGIRNGWRFIHISTASTPLLGIGLAAASSPLRGIDGVAASTPLLGIGLAAASSPLRGIDGATASTPLQGIGLTFTRVELSAGGRTGRSGPGARPRGFSPCCNTLAVAKTEAVCTAYLDTLTAIVAGAGDLDAANAHARTVVVSPFVVSRSSTIIPTTGYLNQQ